VWARKEGSAPHDDLPPRGYDPKSLRRLAPAIAVKVVPNNPRRSGFRSVQARTAKMDASFVILQPLILVPTKSSASWFPLTIRPVYNIPRSAELRRSDVDFARSRF
jgi:hypothetical protein